MVCDTLPTPQGLNNSQVAHSYSISDLILLQLFGIPEAKGLPAFPLIFLTSPVMNEFPFYG